MHIRAAKGSDFTSQIPELIWSEDTALMTLEFETLANWTTVLAKEWPTTGASNCHDSTSLAFQDGEICGLINGFSAQESHQRFERSEALRDDNALSSDEIALIDSLFVDPSDNAFYILDIAVAETAQGLGVGAALMEHAIEIARAKNHNCVELDVYETNPAIGFYKHLGFAITHRTHVPELDRFGVCPHLHMSRAIS